jgi:hypothetical protein
MRFNVDLTVKGNAFDGNLKAVPRFGRMLSSIVCGSVNGFEPIDASHIKIRPDIEPTL